MSLKWRGRLAKSMAISATVVFVPVVLLLIISALASAVCWTFGGHWCTP